MCLVAYVAGHGFGHSVREIEILRRLPEEIPLVVKSAAPEWFWRQEVARSFDFVTDAFDVGCVQHSTLDIDVPGTLAAWHVMDARNRERRSAEADDLRRRGARLVVTDVPSFPLTVAAQLGIPGVCVANFTWADIYAPFIAGEPGFAPVVRQLIEEYRQASLLLEAGLSLPMPYFPHRESVGLVARQGTQRRDDLLARLGPEARGKRLALIYAGNWGMPLPYERLAGFTDWRFLTLSPPPYPVENLSVAAQDWMRHPDLVASVDVALSKLGYGLVGECLLAGTPLVYCPREGFAEYPVIDAALSSWPGGFRLPEDAFLNADWQEVLDRIPAWGSIPGTPADGAARAADRLIAEYRRAAATA